MASKTTLKLLFTGILVAMIVCTAFASTQQSMFQWGKDETASNILAARNG